MAENSAVEDFHHRIINAGGEWQWIAVSASISRDINNKVQQIAGSVHDFSVRKQVEEKLRNLNQELDVRVKRQVAELRHKDTSVQQQPHLAANGK